MSAVPSPIGSIGRACRVDSNCITSPAPTLARMVTNGNRSHGGSVKIAALVAVAVTACALVAAADAKPPKGAVPGKFAISFLVDKDGLAKYMRWSNVFCYWAKDHVIVHVSGKNTSAEHVTAHISPRYYIARGGVHGDGFGDSQGKGFDAGGFRSLWLDAGKPKGVKPGSQISKCAPELQSIESG